MTERYGVIGNPIEHSRSPWIHQQFATQTGQSMRYDRMLAPLDRFELTVRDFFSSGGRGLNVTVPFKQKAWALCDIHSEHAGRAGAVNTLIPHADKIEGHNTDGIGLVRDLTQNYHFPLCGKKILILGAGGAVRGVLQAILAESPSSVILANRTYSRAETLVGLFREWGHLTATTFNMLDESYDLIINGTSASLGGEIPAIPSAVISKQVVCYDMMYSATKTVFNQWAEEQGCSHTLDGKGMLVEQAAESFFLWRGIRPETKRILEQMH